MYYKVNEELCKSCGLCGTDCYIDKKGRNRADPNSEDCSGCGHCYSICPNGAIENITDSDKVKIERVDNRNRVTFETMKNMLSSRRSYRIFSDEKIAKETIDELIQSGVYVPSGGNMHAYEFTVILDENIKSGLIKQIMDLYRQRCIVLKSKFLRMLVYPWVDKQTKGFLKGDRYVKKIQFMLDEFNNGKDIAFYNAPAVIVIHSKTMFPTPKEDAVLVGYNINLLAETKGMGACFVTTLQYALNTSKQCRKSIGLDADDAVHAVIVVGYPKINYVRIPERPSKKVNYMEGVQ